MLCELLDRNHSDPCSSPCDLIRKLRCWLGNRPVGWVITSDIWEILFPNWCPMSSHISCKMYANEATLHFHLIKVQRFCLEWDVLERFRSVILRILDRLNSSKNGAIRQGRMRSTKIAEITSDDSRAKRFSATERLMRVSDAEQEDTLKFLLHSECWSSLSGYSSHWLIITRSRIRRTSSGVLEMIRYCSGVLVEGHASNSWIPEWRTLCM